MTRVALTILSLVAVGRDGGGCHVTGAAAVAVVAGRLAGLGGVGVGGAGLAGGGAVRGCRGSGRAGCAARVGDGVLEGAWLALRTGVGARESVPDVALTRGDGSGACLGEARGRAGCTGRGGFGCPLVGSALRARKAVVCAGLDRPSLASDTGKGLVGGRRDVARLAETGVAGGERGGAGAQRGAVGGALQTGRVWEEERGSGAELVIPRVTGLAHAAGLESARGGCTTHVAGHPRAIVGVDVPCIARAGSDCRRLGRGGTVGRTLRALCGLRAAVEADAARCHDGQVSGAVRPRCACRAVGPPAAVIARDTLTLPESARAGCEGACARGRTGRTSLGPRRRRVGADAARLGSVVADIRLEGPCICRGARAAVCADEAGVALARLGAGAGHGADDLRVGVAGQTRRRGVGGSRARVDSDSVAGRGRGAVCADSLSALRLERASRARSDNASPGGVVARRRHAVGGAVGAGVGDRVLGTPDAVSDVVRAQCGHVCVCGAVLTLGLVGGVLIRSSLAWRAGLSGGAVEAHATHAARQLCRVLAEGAQRLRGARASNLVAETVVVIATRLAGVPISVVPGLAHAVADQFRAWWRFAVWRARCRHFIRTKRIFVALSTRVGCRAVGCHDHEQRGEKQSSAGQCEIVHGRK